MELEFLFSLWMRVQKVGLKEYVKHRQALCLPALYIEEEGEDI